VWPPNSRSTSTDRCPGLAVAYRLPNVRHPHSLGRSTYPLGKLERRLAVPAGPPASAAHVRRHEPPFRCEGMMLSLLGTANRLDPLVGIQRAHVERISEASVAAS